MRKMKRLFVQNTSVILRNNMELFQTQEKTCELKGKMYQQKLNRNKKNKNFEINFIESK